MASLSPLYSVSSVPFSLQSLHPPTSPHQEVQVKSPSTPPPDLVKEDEPSGQRIVEVAIPHVGTFVIESEEGGYDDEVALRPPPPHHPIPPPTVPEKKKHLTLILMSRLVCICIARTSLLILYGSSKDFSHLRKPNYIFGLF